MFEMVKKKNLYEEIAGQVMKKISQGQFRPGQQLPGERELAIQLGVNRGSLREALRVLEFMRVVEKRAGEGVFVRDPARDSSLEAVVFRFLAEDGLDRDSLQGACEAVVITESNLAKLAARRAAPGELEKLKQLMAKMESRLDDAVGFTDVDQEFHLLVGQMGKSPVLFSVVSTMWIIMKKYAGALHIYSERRQKCAAGHRSIAAAIMAGDGETACREMERHLKGGFSILPGGSPGQNSTVTRG